jgi:hypothetical protein
MSEQSDVMGALRHDLPPSEQRVVQALVDEHVHVSCALGAPHGLTATHQDQVNSDLLTFLQS